MNANRSEFTLDIIRPQHVVFESLNVTEMDILICEHVGGIIGYGFGDKLQDLLTVLNHADPNTDENDNYGQDYWIRGYALDENQKHFAASVQKHEIDVICRDASAIGYLMRDNTASYYLITLMNGSHLMPYNKWLAEYQKA